MDTRNIGDKRAKNAAIGNDEKVDWTAPRGMSMQHRKIWKKLIESMPKKNTLNIDQHAIEQMCADIAYLEDLDALLTQDEIRSDFSVYRQTMTIRQSQSRLVHKWMSSFGMTPASRTNLLKVSDEAKPDKQYSAKMHLLKG